MLSNGVVLIKMEIVITAPIRKHLIVAKQHMIG
nr:MAG TPA: hypothetical protein [Caudoviricetes sp.]DAQ57020.1 MAG TPA: hypothetical protein [Caudoviricetes sp.]